MGLFKTLILFLTWSWAAVNILLLYPIGFYLILSRPAPPPVTVNNNYIVNHPQSAVFQNSFNHKTTQFNNKLYVNSDGYNVSHVNSSVTPTVNIYLTFLPLYYSALHPSSALPTARTTPEVIYDILTFLSVLVTMVTAPWQCCVPTNTKKRVIQKRDKACLTLSSCTSVHSYIVNMTACSCCQKIDVQPVSCHLHNFPPPPDAVPPLDRAVSCP